MKSSSVTARKRLSSHSLRMTTKAVIWHFYTRFWFCALFFFKSLVDCSLKVHFWNNKKYSGILHPSGDLGGDHLGTSAVPSSGSSSSTALLVVPSHRKRLPSVSSRRCTGNSCPRPPAEQPPRHRWLQRRLLPESEDEDANEFCLK